jgi:hypothetical protein
MKEIDVWRSAQQLIAKHGNKAASVAAERADKLYASGALSGFREMMRIALAIRELQRSRASGEHAH